MNRRLLWALLSLLSWAAQTAHAEAGPSTFAEQVDALVTEGFEQPVQALSRLDRLRRGSDLPGRRRMLLQAAGSIHASAGASAAAEAVADELSALAPKDPADLMGAGASLVRAQVADNADQLETAATLAQTALNGFLARCESNVVGTPPDCDRRSLWTAYMLLERRARAVGLDSAATAHALSALEVARAAGDSRRQAVNLGALALYAQERNAPEAANAYLSAAQVIGKVLGDARESARFAHSEALLKASHGDWPAGLRILEPALASLENSDSPRLAATLLGSLAEIHLQMGRATGAMHEAERALAVARRFGDRHAERLLTGLISLANSMDRQSPEARARMEGNLDVWKQSGQDGELVRVLRVFSEALAKSGDAKGALELYHRERALTDRLLEKDRTEALKELRRRNDTDVQDRQISLMSQEKALTVDILANRELQQHVWQTLAAVMTAVIALSLVLYDRVRKTNRQLGVNRIRLRSQSDSDPLTHLMNRRHFHSVMAARDPSVGFEGTLMMIDVDHFKQVNDVHGHAAGDKVLVEVAKRLKDSCGVDDLVVRWGGEEFLVFASHSSADQAQAAAARILGKLGGLPVSVGDTDLHVTASIGYARFPLPGAADLVRWDQAVRLVDAAMYEAKIEGRNRTVGLISVMNEADVMNIEEGLHDAVAAGRVVVVQTRGVS